ncbi:Uncharacterised protein [uncultured Clostridium sp.]|nr:Uncharacterised protein [uncultured Clostridium sp.]SCJ45463.1 Uncharacterised protein [uncultured Clostridium sp.]
MRELCVKGFLLKEKIKNRAFDSLTSNKGEGYVDSGVKVLIAVVIGAVLLAGLYALFNETIMPTMKSKIEGMFNFKG